MIATGGTGAAAIRLVRGLGAELVGMAVLIELAFLNGRQALGEVDLHTVVTYG